MRLSVHRERRCRRELDLRVRATDRLDVSLGVGYQHAKITEKGESPQPVGSPVFNTPDWTGNGALTYTLPLTNNWNSVSVIDYSYMGSSFSANNSPTNPRKRPAYRLLNARFGFSNGKTELALVGKNLTNEVTNLGDNRSIAAEVPGRPRLFLNQPRTIGIEVTQRF
jgi:iron complex outermembrane recepter protein